MYFLRSDQKIHSRIKKYIVGCKTLTASFYRDSDKKRNEEGWFDESNRSLRLHDLSNDADIKETAMINLF